MVRKITGVISFAIHFCKMVSAICFSGFPYSRFQLLKSYCRILNESISYHRSLKGRGANLRSLFFSTQSIFDFTICFSHYGQLIDMFEEIFILQSYKHRSREKENVIIDVGANIGIAVLYFKLQNASSNVICFEPHDETFRLLQLNVKQNNLLNVTLHNVALGSREGTGILYGNRQHSLNMSLHEDQGDYKKEFQQPISINLLSSFLEGEVTLLKIDAEGSEKEIVQDIVASGKVKHLQEIIIEFHPRPTTTLMELSNLLVPFGFKLKTRRTNTKTKETLLEFYK
jgi:FkbM family methyltransferase